MSFAGAKEAYLLQRRAQVSLMHWTSKIPKTAGWYWRSAKNDRQIVEVYMTDGQLMYGLMSPSRTAATIRDMQEEDGVLWAGPIPLPETDAHVR